MPKIFDSHFHIIDKNFPLVFNRGYMPVEFTVADYESRALELNIAGGAVVSGSFHGFDQEYLVNSLEKLGKQFVGVAQLPVDVSEKEILKLDALNVRGVRFNIKRLDPIDIEEINSLATRVFDIAGWHSEFYNESSELENHFEIIKDLPSVSIDHLGLTKKGFKKLLEFVERGVKVKASGFGRIELDPVRAMRDIYSANPDSLMFGTDLPSTRAKRPFHIDDINLILENFSEEEQSKIFFENGMKFYRLN